jgi:hypothetical protein
VPAAGVLATDKPEAAYSEPDQVAGPGEPDDVETEAADPQQFRQSEGGAHGPDQQPGQGAAGGDPTEEDWLYEAAAAQIREIIVPRSTDPFAVLRAKGLARIIKHLRQVDHYRGVAAASELADLREMLGAEVTTPDEGRRLLAHRVRHGQADEREVFRYFSRRVARQSQLLRPAMGSLADRHFEPLA